jgi:predicted enzyme related to lactoylglutathione lyase
MQLHGKDVAGFHGIPQSEQSWLGYIAVESADSTGIRAKDLGAKICVAPFDVPGVGRMSMLQDPAGGTFALWEAKGHRGARLVEEPGTMLWNELIVHDVNAAREFYSRLFGWSTREMRVPTGDYMVFMSGDRQVAGLMQIGKDWGPVSPHWQIFFAVKNCDADIARTKALGGSLLFGPVDVPKTGRFALLADPCDGVFLIMAPPA